MFIHLFEKYQVSDDLKNDGELNMICDAMGDACVMTTLIDQLLTGASNDFDVTEALDMLSKWVSDDGRCLFFGDTIDLDDRYGLAEIRTQLIDRVRSIDRRFRYRLESLNLYSREVA